MSDHQATVTPGPCGILHITIGPDHEPPTSPPQKMQQAISQLATDLDLIDRAHGGRETRDHEPMAERTVLNIEQAQALHHALIDYQQKRHDRGLDLLAPLAPPPDLRPPLPACPTCGKTPDVVSVRDSMATLATNIDFTPCGHGFYVTNETLERLARIA